MGKLLVILFLGGALANTLAHVNAQPPLLIDNGSSLDGGR
jgi:hypothetical protein